MFDCLHADKIKAAVAENNNLDLDVVVHQVVDSTNSWSLQQSRAGKVLPFACFAEEQTSGRGRRGKQWLMPAYSNIALSLAWPFKLSLQQLQLLPLSISIAISETLEDFNLVDVQIKWPNDVYVGGKKIAGTLIETQPLKNDQVAVGAADENHAAVVIGVGLNYDMSVLRLDQIDDLPVFTDICFELKPEQSAQMPERTGVASRLLQRVIEVCQSYQSGAVCNLERFRSRYDYCLGKEVEIILDNGDVLSGVAQGVNDNAELLVIIEGKQHTFNSAEVSVKAG